ncbi:MAG: HAD family hydrolase [Bacteriovoracaceae bacterium]
MSRHVIFDCDGTLIDTSQYRYSLFPGIKDLIIDLSKDCELYVWTARDRLSTLRYLKEFEIIQYFSEISTPDDALAKPNSEGIRRLVGAHDKTSVCMIGDSSADIVGAKNFGVMSIGANWWINTDTESLITSGADFIVSDPVDCSKLIRLNLKEN